MTLYTLLKRELLAVFTNPALLLTVFGGVLFYSVLYPLPYASQKPTQQKVVVVDLDASQFSRNITRMIDATPQVQITKKASSLEEATSLMDSGRFAGMLVIPENFYRDLLIGKRPSLSFAGDASYFLVFSTVLEGMSAAGQTMAAQVKVTRLMQSGQAVPLAKEQYSPVKLRLHALFNEAEGYVNYVVPAVFVLILHQTLFMGIGILCGSENEQLQSQLKKGEKVYWIQASPLVLTLVRSFVFLGIYLLLSLYYFGPCLMMYDLPRLASVLNLSVFALLFLFSVSFLGIAAGGLFKYRELATVVVLLSSLVLVFACGFIWPESAIPETLVLFVNLIPAVPAIKGFVQLNQMGASLHQVLPLMQHLAVLGIVYFLLAYLVLARRRRIALILQQKV